MGDASKAPSRLLVLAKAHETQHVLQRCLKYRDNNIQANTKPWC